MTRFVVSDEGAKAGLQDTARYPGDAPPRIVERSTDGVDALDAIEPPLLRRIYAGRGVRSVDELDYRLRGLPHFRDLKGIEEAAALLARAIAGDRRILVVGDFDADGATSTALVCDALGDMGAARVDYFVPHRARHGYGLSPRVVAAIGSASPGSLLVTVDNGIASVDGVDAAHAGGWQVLVCDHHLPGEALPAADAIVNPNQPGCAFAGKALAGVGVAFYLMAALRTHLAAGDPARVLPKMNRYLDLVAIGTVADVVALDHLNRTLVSQGLRRIRQGRARAGIVALIEAAGREAIRLDAADIGFAVAPRLNAAGRLDDMGIGIDCLREPDIDKARALAGELATINRRRQSVQQRMQAEAEAALAALSDTPAERAGLTVYREDWHEGVVGLIAGRLRERHHRPVVAFAPGEHGDLKGSARSIPGLHIRDVLAAIDARQPGLIQQFGGHAQAAGLSLGHDAIEAFDLAFDAAIAARMTPSMRAREHVTDGELDDDDHSLGVAQQLRDAGPWGAAFEPPLFHGVYCIVDQRLVGNGHLKMRVRPTTGRATIEAMWFGHDRLLDDSWAYRLVFRLAVNEFRGARRANLIVAHAQPEKRT